MQEWIGKHKHELDTPALIVDLDRLQRNIDKMAEFFNGVSADLRPHFKTPKTVEIAKMQIEAGAKGITCAKVSEAEVLVEGGIKDILIANEIIGKHKTAKLAELNKKADVMCAVDDPAQVAAISEAAVAAGVAIGILVDIYVGLPRCGVQPDAAAVLAREVDRAPGLELRGVMGYEGHVVFIEDDEERKSEADISMGMLTKAAEVIRAAGLPCEIVSGAGTGTYRFSGSYPGVTEIQAGSYCLMDVRYGKIQPEFEKAATILATVCSTAPALPGWAVTDAGLKSVTPEMGLPELIGVPDTAIVRLSEEHSQMFCEKGEPAVKVGDKVELYPSHICTTINLYDTMYVVQNEKIVHVWEIKGRGKNR